MTLDIDKLEQHALASTNGCDGIERIGNHAEMLKLLPPSAVLELINRLRAAEKCLFQMQNAAIDLGKKLEAAEKDAARYLEAIIAFRKGDLISVERASSEEFAKYADASDWDEIDHEKIMAELELNRIADEAMKEKP